MSSRTALIYSYTSLAIVCISSSLSILGSSAIVISSYKKIGSIYQRLIFMISMTDIISSLAYIVQPFLLPSYYQPYLPLASGNHATCTLGGFFIVFGPLLITFYSFYLSLFFYVKIKYNMNEAMIIKKRYPLYANIIAWVVSLGIPLIGVGVDGYRARPNLTICHLGNCQVGDPTGQSCYITTTNELISYVLYFMYVGIIMFLALCSVACCVLLYTSVRQQLSKNRRYEFQQQRSFTATANVTTTTNSTSSSGGMRDSILGHIPNSTPQPDQWQQSQQQSRNEAATTTTPTITTTATEAAPKTTGLVETIATGLETTTGLSATITGSEPATSGFATTTGSGITTGSPTTGFTATGPTTTTTAAAATTFSLGISPAMTATNDPPTLPPSSITSMHQQQQPEKSQQHEQAPEPLSQSDRYHPIHHQPITMADHSDRYHHRQQQQQQQPAATTTTTMGDSCRSDRYHHQRRRSELTMSSADSTRGDRFRLHRRVSSIMGNHSGRAKQQYNHKILAVRNQAILYSLAYWNSFVWIFLTLITAFIRNKASRYADHQNDGNNTAALVIAYCIFIFYPLQGFLNFIIYTRPRYLEYRHNYPQHGRWYAIKQAITLQPVNLYQQRRFSVTAPTTITNRSRIATIASTFTNRLSVTQQDPIDDDHNDNTMSNDHTEGNIDNDNDIPIVEGNNNTSNDNRDELNDQSDHRDNNKANVPHPELLTTTDDVATARTTELAVVEEENDDDASSLEHNVPDNNNNDRPYDHPLTSDRKVNDNDDDYDREDDTRNLVLITYNDVTTKSPEAVVDKDGNLVANALTLQENSNHEILRFL